MLPYSRNKLNTPRSAKAVTVLTTDVILKRHSSSRVASTKPPFEPDPVQLDKATPRRSPAGAPRCEPSRHPQRKLPGAQRHSLWMNSNRYTFAP